MLIASTALRGSTSHQKQRRIAYRAPRDISRLVWQSQMCTLALSAPRDITVLRTLPQSVCNAKLVRTRTLKDKTSALNVHQAAIIRLLWLIVQQLEHAMNAVAGLSLEKALQCAPVARKAVGVPRLVELPLRHALLRNRGITLRRTRAYNSNAQQAASRVQQGARHA